MALVAMSRIVGHVLDSLNQGPRMAGTALGEMLLTVTLWSRVPEKCLRV
jgi:hypothetical protein